MIDDETKLKLYMLIASRYKDLINEKEHKSISEIRMKCSPYREQIKKLKQKIIGNVVNYSYESDFAHVADRVLDYVKEIKNFELLISFWMDFGEIDEIKAANPLDKAIIATALLRALDSPNARVAATKKNRFYVRFEYNGKKYLINPQNGSMISGDDVDKMLKDEGVSYEFNDLVFETNE